MLPMQVGSNASRDKEEGSSPEEHQLELAKDAGQAFAARFWRKLMREAVPLPGCQGFTLPEQPDGTTR